MVDSPWALLPPVIAFVVVVWRRQVLVALGAGGLAGACLLALDAHGPWGLLLGPLFFVRDGLLGQVAQASNAQVLFLVGLIAGFVGLLEGSGAARALVGGMGRWVAGPRRAEGAAFVAGLLLFFSDIGNVLILGPVFRPLFDRLGLARERLAWIVDATAAPVSVLVPFITWGVFIIGLLDVAFPDEQGLSLFIAAWPYQLYPLLSILFVGAMAWFGQHFGPMSRAVAVGPAASDSLSDLPARTGLVPLVVLFAVLLAVGGGLWAHEGALKGPSVRLALACAYLAATGVLAAMVPEPWGRVAEGVGRSTRLMGLLVLAWTLASVCRSLGTGAVVAALLGPWMPVALLPVALFCLGAAVSFATGTSWGTFAILIPIASSLCEASGLPAGLLVGAVLSGGVFGDHSSPISDTTLLASASCGVEHDDHVRTQLPYALVVGVASALGFVVAGFAGPAGLALGGLVVVALVGATRWQGTKNGGPEGPPFSE